MTIRDMEQKDCRYLKITDLENFFNIYVKNNKYCYNLNTSIYFDIDKSALKTYTLKTRAFWPLISYQIYKTTHLAWLLCKLNDVQTKDIFKQKQPGDVIYYYPNELKDSLIASINS